MPDASTITAVALPPNPVWRSYTGGRVLRAYRGCGETSDHHFPEDWLASTVRARNGTHAQHELEGLSRVAVANDSRPLLDLFREQPDFWFGPTAPLRSGETGVLWKLLDSSVRLQIQAHPDRAFARRHLNSTAGKTECWYILGTRGPAHVYLGFQNPPTRQSWETMLREQRVDDMLACFEQIEVKPGECYVVPAGTPHAIGAGVFMLELQEPTDWVVRCETTNAGLMLPPEACFMGLDLERCLDVFDYRDYPVAEVRRRFQQTPRIVRQEKIFREEEIISAKHHEFFRLHRLNGHGNAHWHGGELLLLIIVKGEATLVCDQSSQLVRAGQTWLLPGAAASWEWTKAAGDWEILIAKMPVPQTSLSNPPES